MSQSLASSPREAARSAELDAEEAQSCAALAEAAESQNGAAAVEQSPDAAHWNTRLPRKPGLQPDPCPDSRPLADAPQPSALPNHIPGAASIVLVSRLLPCAPAPLSWRRRVSKYWRNQTSAGSPVHFGNSLPPDGIPAESAHALSPPQTLQWNWSASCLRPDPSRPTRPESVCSSLPAHVPDR